MGWGEEGERGRGEEGEEGERGKKEYEQAALYLLICNVSSIHH